MYRAYCLKHDINLSKQKKINDVLREYRKTAKLISDNLWNSFYDTSKLERFIDTKSIASVLSERYKQTCLAQVRGMISSFIENRKNDFKEYVYRSSIKDEDTRIKLLFINKHNLWFSRDAIVIKEIAIENDVIILARNIARRCFKTNRKPNTHYIGLALDAKVAELSVSKEGYFDYWIKLATMEKGKPVYLPLKSNDYFENIDGKLANFVQINSDRNGALSLSLIKDLPKSASYAPIIDKIGIDVGLSCLITTSKGDTFSKAYFFDYLKKQDERLVELVKRLRKTGLTPNKSKKYRNLVSNVRAFIKNNVNRAFNRIVELYAPNEIVVERLNFQNQSLGKRMNRIIGNFGKGVISKKLDSLNELYGIKITEVNPAYTSKICSTCGYVSQKSRKNQATFICAFCGKSINADINASRNILARSSSVSKGIYKTKAFILQNTVDSFLERPLSHNSLARAVNNSKYFELAITDESCLS